ncbi:ABC transporter ATP-binding protein [Ruminococcus sp. CLA-AA-H200]|uniref:ABC transporter ATP-binding protein n=1 Tax=Ruminococcus turbiniformis TaxID=2881258 RepID=A0ABS8FWT6_9FIRM|nr:ABC transporter ATP-binding protein [Ruminococcus turbiniformis]MCC2254515.1 ABC transporter ATP-binding protein [Ruminococcus turbiniformis]
MIRISDLVKTFDDTCAADHISLEIPEGILFGLLGTNGAGKTTLLRLTAGILEADSGEILVDGEPAGASEKVFYLPDTPYYFPNATIEQMAGFYGRQYREMDTEGVRYMAESLNLDMRQPIRTFSKGMKRQAFLILALCARTKYLLCDEVFDGLDPIASEVMKNLFRQEMRERKFTAVVASHRLPELEDICDNIAILHKGGVVTAGDMRMKAENIWKFQCVFHDADDRVGLEKELDVVRCHTDVNFVTLIVRGDREEIRTELYKRRPVFVAEVPMSLEEIFIAEMEVKGYDIRKVLH